MRYEVTAVAINRRTREQVGAARTEKIDTATNIIFSSCDTPLDVEQAYESFWDINPLSTEVVKVISVRRIKGGN